MRIALATEAFYPAVDGTTRTVKAVADRLIDTGHEVAVIAPGPGLASYRGSPVVRTGIRLRLGSQVGTALADLRPDLVHLASGGPLGRTARGEARRLGIPTLELAPGSWLPGVDCAAFNPGLRDPWLHASWSRGRSCSGHSRSGHSRSGHSGGPLVVVGFVGPLEAHHGVRRLAGLATLPGIRPVVIGDGSMRGWLEARLPGARFTGALATGDLAVALASLDVLVHPGDTETCCHALREAAASGIPVVAPRSGGATHVVRSLETGLLHDPEDSGGFLRAVGAVAADPHRALLGARARELALERDWGKAVDELVERHYLPLLGRGDRISPAA
ncbi:MAG TPA: glycosyltransferase [Pedococcus sp.]|nr:glycosyltransferase [Pedococcus sp.]